MAATLEGRRQNEAAFRLLFEGNPLLTSGHRLFTGPADGVSVASRPA